MTPTTPVYRWIQMAKCEECGAAAGERCMTLDDERADHPCEGRKRHTAVRVGDLCPRGHRVVGANVLTRGKYQECRECHNEHARQSMARRRAKKAVNDAERLKKLAEHMDNIVGVM
jgi:hypothetical protein